MNVTVNGAAREIAPATTLAELLRALELNPRFLAVERNLEVVPRTEHDACVLRDGDELEIVTLVGGG